MKIRAIHMQQQLAAFFDDDVAMPDFFKQREWHSERNSDSHKISF